LSDWKKCTYFGDKIWRMFNSKTVITNDWRPASDERRFASPRGLMPGTIQQTKARD